MGSRQIRTGQLIAPFGPGSLYTDRYGVPYLVAGLDHWFMEVDRSTGRLMQCSNPGEFEIFEPRLSALLGVDRFRRPPDYRQPVSGQENPPNAKLTIPALRFPRWYRNTQTGLMRRFSLDTRSTGQPSGGGRWQPVRFISVCSNGHISDFPWKEWISCDCHGDGELILTDRGGSELTSITVRCKSCPPDSEGARGRSLSGTTTRPKPDTGEKTEFEKAGIRCASERAWLGDEANDSLCAGPLVGALINQTNIYFPKTASAIRIPLVDEPKNDIAAIRSELEHVSTIALIRTFWKLQARDQAASVTVAALRELGIEVTEGQAMEALMSLFEGGELRVPGAAVPVTPESDLQSFRRAEYNVIRAGVDDSREDRLRVIPSTVPTEIAPWIGRVGLVERLCETRVFYGFNRLEPDQSPLADMPESAMRQLFRFPPESPAERWLPAVEVYGEGLYFELSEDGLSKWLEDNRAWIRHRIDEAFLKRLQETCWTIAPLQPATLEWAARFLLVHTLAHILVNQLVFECGYSTASLRERLFISDDPHAPMAGFMIYTAAGDSEGTLGGLVRLGQPKLLGAVFERAINRASWCSADPVCSEHMGGQGSRQINLAACHACALLPETCCETINHGLDRAMVVGTPAERNRGLLSPLIERGLRLGNR
jgi:hypothetical protein